MKKSMEFLHPKMNMEFGELDSSLGAFWSPAFENDGFNSTFVLNERGDGNFGIAENATENRSKLAAEMLKELESSQAQNYDPCCEWLEEPMDLEVFGQSLVESPAIPLGDEADYFPLSPGPPSPLTPQAPTPIHPASPQELYPSQGDLFSLKDDVPVIAIPAQNEELLESLELLLHEIAAVESTSDQPQVIQEEEEEDITSALLESLMNGHVAEEQVNEELAEFITLINRPKIELCTVSASPIVPIPPASIGSTIRICSSESKDPEWIPTPRTSGRKSNSSQPIATTPSKPRKKSLRADDRRLRKKEQNKTAATRYRIKKKVELDILLDEEAALEQRNLQLQMQHDELASEVRYLKKLMREIFNNRRSRWTLDTLFLSLVRIRFLHLIN